MSKYCLFLIVIYVGVENEFVLETVFALFKERNKDFFTFE